MKKKEFINRYGVEAYGKRLTQKRAHYRAHSEEAIGRAKQYREAHPEQMKACSKIWLEKHPEEVRANNQEASRKGGRRYDKYLEYNQTGLRGERHKIRIKHNNKWRPYKRIIAPNSQCHHQWRPQSALYDGLALVEADRHMHGFISVIEILEGKITLLTEEEVRG